MNPAAANPLPSTKSQKHIANPLYPPSHNQPNNEQPIEFCPVVLMLVVPLKQCRIFERENYNFVT